MENTNLKKSARMALVLGIFLPFAETIRRANQLLEIANFFKWFDDYMIGFVLIIIAYRALKQKGDYKSYLIAVWGITVGGHILSFISQFNYYSTPKGDPGLFSTTFVVIVKAILLIYMLIGLRLSIKANSIE